MTTPNPSFLDPNNQLLSGGPARLDVGSMEHPQMGKVGLITIRTSSTTLTVLMNPESLHEWAGILNGLADQMGGAPKLQAAGPQDLAGIAQALKRVKG